MSFYADCIDQRSGISDIVIADRGFAAGMAAKISCAWHLANRGEPASGAAAPGEKQDLERSAEKLFGAETHAT
jgi:hypothetical protein